MKKKKLNLRVLLTYGILAAVCVLVFVLIETGVASRQFKSLVVPLCVNMMLALSLNLIVGFLGELTLGHAGFMSVGAYAGCLLSVYLEGTMPMALRLPLVMLFGGLVAALFGLVIGIPVLRLKGDYLAIVTLAFGEIIRSIILNLDFTGGAAGINNVPRDIYRGSNYLIAFVLVFITLIVITNLVYSKQGRAITAIRDNRIAAESIGINITYYKLLAFVIAAFFAGVAGVLYGHNIGQLDANKFDYNRSIEILVIVVLGGMGSIPGSLIAAGLITVIPEVLRTFSDYRLLVYAIVLIAVMIINASPRMQALRARFSVRRLWKLIRGRRRKKEA
ncbi:MAG: branched-chain amino acid ABC transporter permease [Clostridia bacterium]|nr:branched-chain amino acid ABC transporter permease [Clostridia bacterium]